MPASEPDEYLSGLVRMANQIAQNVGGVEVARAVAEHLERFWDPAMRRDLAEAITAGTVAPHPAVREAMSVLRQPPES